MHTKSISVVQYITESVGTMFDDFNYRSYSGAFLVHHNKIA